MSGVGKGIATAAIGQILQNKGFKVNPIKVDPYLNVDAGTMNPTEHGEVFVLDSGLETDQDMGNYERFMNIDLRREDYITSGMVYRHVIEKERNLGYGGKCVEAIPHITGEIIRRYKKASEISGSNISIIEIGGTVGDYQNTMFIEAARILKLKNPDDVVFIMVSYLPLPNHIGEMKTRPTQNAVRALNSYGVQPDIIIARSRISLDHKRKEKIATTCNVHARNVISAPDIENIYEVPINFEKDKLGEILTRSLKVNSKPKKNGLTKWKKFVQKSKKNVQSVRIAIIGKYFDTGDFMLSDAYLSVIEAVKFSSYSLGVKPEFTWVNSKDFENGKSNTSILKKFDGIIVPGGFGETGILGKILAIKYARENKIPYLGLCYGMQLAVIEFAQNVAKIKDATSGEMNENSKSKVIDIMIDQKEKLAKGDYGGSMRLGSYPAKLTKGTVAYESYKSHKIKERHRHRYEVNTEFIAVLEKAGLVFSGKSPDGRLMEIAELPKDKHPFFLGTQFHPEFKARPLEPHPLFSQFIKAAKKKS